MLIDLKKGNLPDNQVAPISLAPSLKQKIAQSSFYSITSLAHFVDTEKCAGNIFRFFLQTFQQIYCRSLHRFRHYLRLEL